jgi:hypothetical protein
LTYGDVKLDGVKYRLAGEFTQKNIGEPVKRSFVAYYIDSGASTEQREALRKLLTGPSFAGTGQSRAWMATCSPPNVENSVR